MRGRALLALIGVCAAASTVCAHPYHVSMSEATVNREKQRLEVAMRAFPEDVEAALIRKFERDVDLERTEDIDALLTEYLRGVFTLRDPNEPAPEPGAADETEPTQDETAEAEEPPRFTLMWVGKEVEPRDVWLYFTISLDRDIEGLELSVRAMFEVEATQENIVILADGERRVTLRCDHERPKMIVDFTSVETASDK